MFEISLATSNVERTLVYFRSASCEKLNIVTLGINSAGIYSEARVRGQREGYTSPPNELCHRKSEPVTSDRIIGCEERKKNQKPPKSFFFFPDFVIPSAAN